MPEPQKFSDELESWLSGDGPKTLEELGNTFAERSFAVTILLLMFVPALPLPTGGITHVFEVITVVIALQMVLGRRTMWLPRKWKQRELGATIGYSDHTIGVQACLAAVALGARILEKHFTLRHDFSDFRDHQLFRRPRGQ